MNQLTRFVLCSLLFAAVGEASAQVAVTLDKDEYGNGDAMLVTVTLAPGQSVSKPRFHFIADGTPLPKKSSTRWVDFPTLTMTQQLKLVAPDAVEWNQSAAWWLLLYDGDRLIARLPFDMSGGYLLLDRKRAELESQLSRTGESRAAAESRGIGEAAIESPTVAGGVSSLKGYMQMATQEPLIGEVFTVTVTLPPPSGGEPGSALLKWGDSENLPWNEKEKAPESGDSISAEVPGSVTGPQTISVTAPFSKPGTYDLRLFRGGRLLDVLKVHVSG